MIEVGKLCMKISGRDAGQRCVVLSKAEDNRVLVDGETRRRLVNVAHLEPLANDPVKIKENAGSSDIEKLCKELQWVARKTKPKKATERPKKQKIQRPKTPKKPEKKQPEKAAKRSKPSQ